jgi:hypothetical protein
MKHAATLTRQYVVVGQEDLLVFITMPPHHLLHPSTNRARRLLEDRLGIHGSTAAVSSSIAFFSSAFTAAVLDGAYVAVSVFCLATTIDPPPI